MGEIFGLVSLRFFLLPNCTPLGLLYQGVVSILHRPYCFKRTTCTTVVLARAGCEEGDAG